MSREVLLWTLLVLALPGALAAQAVPPAVPEVSGTEDGEPDGDLILEEGLAFRSGEEGGLFAAHRSLPPGSTIRVMNLENSRSLDVTVESYLDESANRLLNLSGEAADLLGIGENAWVGLILVDGGPAGNPVEEGEEFQDDGDIAAGPVLSGAAGDPGRPASGQNRPPALSGNGAVALVQAEPRAPGAAPAPAGTAVNAGTGAFHQVLPEPVDQLVITVNRQENGGWDVSVAPGRNRPAPSPAPPAPDADLWPANPSAMIRESRGPANVLPRMPPGGDSRTWQVQAGSFISRNGALRVLAHIEAAGYRGILERNGHYTRVVIPSISSAEVPELARRLGMQGVGEIWLRSR